MKYYDLFQDGKFFLGCNYWASNAGTHMWREWDEEVVRGDIARLAAAKLPVMRVFPNWADFQPIRMHYKYATEKGEMRMGEDPLPETKAGQAGVSEVMVERFRRFLDIGHEYGMKFVVGLVTGFMSGRIFAPEAFVGRDLITDPYVIKWQIKFVKYMVSEFRDHPAISAWDLGNECNNMGRPDKYQAYNWASIITNTIKSIDPDRPVISGMHGTRPEANSVWNICEQSDILDIFCTHPYPLFTPHCDTDPINEMKTVCHATAESLYYGGCAQKPCFIEAAGTLGPFVANETVKANYTRASIFSSWAHNLYGFLWWCANEQSALTKTPYDWNSVERELGLFFLNGEPKPVCRTMGELSEYFDNFEYGKLPPRIVDAVCILTRNQQTWANAYGTFILAKQAGVDIEFAFTDNPLPDAKTYFVPGLCGDASFKLHKYKELLSKVEAGATLVLSIDNALLSPFNEVFGIVPTRRQKRVSTDYVCTSGGGRVPFESSFKLELEPTTANVLIATENGDIAVSENKYGKGRVIFITSPIEFCAATKPQVVSGEDAVPYYKIYSALGIDRGDKVATSNSPYLCITEHPCNENERVLTLINYVSTTQSARISLSEGWRFKKLIPLTKHQGFEEYRGAFEITLPENGCTVAVIERI